MPMAHKDRPTKHVAIVGVTGAGKSTLINVLTGSMLARVTNDAKPCTPQPKHYDMEKEGVKYCLWDTRGLNEAQEEEAMGPIARLLKFLRGISAADRELRDFLRRKNPRFDLILFCIEAEKIQVPSHWKNYDKIYARFCRKKIKVAVVVTRMDSNTTDTDWRKTCGGMIDEVVGEFPDARLVEGVPAFMSLEETAECNGKIWRLISKFSRKPSDTI